MTPAPLNPPARPRPLVDAATEKASLPAVVGTLLTSLLITGVVTREQFDLLSLAMAAAAVLVTLLTTLLAVLRTVRAAEARVTPIHDPRSDTGEQLVPHTGQVLAEVLEQLAAQLRPDVAPPAEQAAERVFRPGDARAGVLSRMRAGEDVLADPDPLDRARPLGARRDPATTRLPTTRRSRHARAGADDPGPDDAGT